VLDETWWLTLLFDTYGAMLSEKQRQFFTLYHEEDWSFGEIAVQYGISRQAVYDIVKRAEKTLYELEAALGVAAREVKWRRRAEKVASGLAEVKNICRGLPGEAAALALSQLDRVEAELSLWLAEEGS